MPTLTVCIRKAFGAAWQGMNGSMMPSHGVYAWPGAEIGLMDSEIGVNVAYGTQLARIGDEVERARERQARIAAIAEQTSPFPAAGTMRIDEVIDPADTRRILAADLDRLAHRRVPPLAERALATWSTC